MTAGCPSCGSADATRHGTKARRLLDVGADGVPGHVETRAQRWRCSGCGHHFTELPGLSRPRSLATVAARDAVAEACFDAGYAAAGARFGIDEKTARSLWDAWAASRADELPSRPPEEMGLHLVTVAGVERALVTDAEALAVVDLLRGASARDVDEWFERVGGADRVAGVVVGFHQPFRDAIAARAPGARVRVLREHARSQGMRAFLSAFRSVRRSCGRRAGSNVREEPRIFARPAGELSPAEREGMGAWDDAVLDLHEAKERFMEALAQGSRERASEILADARRRCLAIPGASVPASLLGNWRDEIAAGCAAPGRNPFPALLGEMAVLWSRRRPPLPFDLARGLALLRDGPRATEEDPEEGFERILGVPMDEVCRALASPVRGP